MSFVQSEMATFSMPDDMEAMIGMAGHDASSVNKESEDIMVPVDDKEMEVDASPLVDNDVTVELEEGEGVCVVCESSFEDCDSTRAQENPTYRSLIESLTQINQNSDH